MSPVLLAVLLATTVLLALAGLALLAPADLPAITGTVALIVTLAALTAVLIH